jgi:hypothetical protein
MMNIGEFFINECCEEVGYNCKGELIGEDGEIIEDEIVETEGEGSKGEESGEELESEGEGESEGEESEEEVESEEVSEEGEESEEVEGDIDGDGDVDAADVELAVDYEKMGQKELMAECDKKGIKYKKNESKDSLREMLKA